MHTTVTLLTTTLPQHCSLYYRNSHVVLQVITSNFSPLTYLYCRYIKAYWSKMKIRDTVISEEQERMLLERILSEEENDRDDVSDRVTIM